MHPPRCFGTALRVAAMWALFAVPARADLHPGLFMDLGTAAIPETYTTQAFSDTAGIRLFVERDSLPKLEGMEFLLGYRCRVDSACHVARSLRVLSFEPNPALISTVERITCDSCFVPTHYRVHIRADRLSSLAQNLKALVGTFHVRVETPISLAELHFELAFLWTFGTSAFEFRAMDVTDRTNTARVGGVSAARETRWGILRMIYR